MSFLKLTRRDFLRCSTAISVLSAASQVACAQSKQKNQLRGFGVNCFDLFLGPLLNQYPVRGASLRLNELAAAGVSFVRFPVSVFWPKQWKYFTEDQRRYFDLLDEVFLAADRHRIGLVPTFFWNVSSVSDFLSEPVSAWGDDASETAAFADRFVDDLLKRYGGQSGIVALEFANEINTYADLSDGYRWWPKVDEKNGTPGLRTSKDVIKSKDVVSATSRFSRKARALVNGAPLSGGFDAPRNNSFNLSRGRSARDVLSEMREYQDWLNQDLDVVSLHLYPRVGGRSQLMLRENFKRELPLFVDFARASGKTVFLGEFGLRRGGSSFEDRKSYEELLLFIANSGVRAAALWVYDYAPMRGDWSVSFNGDRSYQLELIAKYANTF